MEANEPFTGWLAIVRLILYFAIIWAAGRWALRRSVTRVLLPRKHRLEALLKELDGPESADPETRDAYPRRPQ
jgi:hypothetical protein